MENNNAELNAKMVLSTLEELKTEKEIQDKKIEKLEKDKDEQNKEIERLKKDDERHERRTNVLELQIIEDRRANADDRKATSQRISDIHKTVNLMFKLVVFTLEELNKLKELISTAAKTAAENFDPENVAPDPQEGEVDFMDSLVEYKGWTMTGEGKEMKKFCNDLRKSLKTTQGRCMTSGIKATISTAVKAVKNISDDSKIEARLSEGDDQSATQLFVEDFTTGLLKVRSANDWKVVVVKIAVNMLIIGGVYINASLKLRKMNKERLEAIKSRLNKFMGKLDEYMLNPTKEEFDKMQEHYIASMIKFNNKSDVHIGEFKVPYDTHKTFDEIPDYVMKYPPNTQEIERLKNSIDIELFDWRDYLMRGLEDNEIDYFKYMCSVDRAINRKEDSEFRNFNWCGLNKSAKEVAVISIITAPLLGFGLLYGGVNATLRIQFERQWAKNISDLIEIMRHCIIDFQTNELNRMIEIRKHIFLVENYYKATLSKYGKHHYETEYVTKYKYLYVLPNQKLVFDACLDLYFQFTNEERYNPKNYTEYSYQIVKQEAPALNKTAKIFKQIVTEIAATAEFESKQDQETIDNTRELPALADGTKQKITIKRNMPSKYLGTVKDVNELFAQLIA